MSEKSNTPAATDYKTHFMMFNYFEDGEAERFYEWLHPILENHTNSNRKKEVTIYINSYGGFLHELFPMIDGLNMLKEEGFTVKTFVSGVAMSCGFILFLQGTRGHRYITPLSQLLSHPYSSGKGGTYYDLKESRESEDWLMEQLFELYQTALPHQSKQFIQEKLLKQTDSFILPENAVKLGIADKIIGRSQPVVSAVPTTNVIKKVPGSVKKKKA